MSTKRRNLAFVTRRLRRALNGSDTPPTRAGRKLVRCGYGQGANQRDIDATDHNPTVEDGVVVSWDLGEFDTEGDLIRAENDSEDWQQYAKCAA